MKLGARRLDKIKDGLVETERSAEGMTGHDHPHAAVPFTLMIKGKLDFGPWEQIFYGEFDGRRRKRVLVKIIGE